jgi:hypothetical protein
METGKGRRISYDVALTPRKLSNPTGQDTVAEADGNNTIDYRSVIAAVSMSLFPTVRIHFILHPVFNYQFDAHQIVILLWIPVPCRGIEVCPGVSSRIHRLLIIGSTIPGRLWMSGNNDIATICDWPETQLMLTVIHGYLSLHCAWCHCWTIRKWNQYKIKSRVKKPIGPSFYRDTKRVPSHPLVNLYHLPKSLLHVQDLFTLHAACSPVSVALSPETSPNILLTKVLHMHSQSNGKCFRSWCGLLFARCPW